MFSKAHLRDARQTEVGGMDADVLKVAFAEILSDYDVLKILKNVYIHIGRLIPEERPRKVIARFKSERRRNAVHKTRASVKTHNATTETHRIFVNEDLTNQRAGLLFELRNISHCSSFNGNILMKIVDMKVRQVQTKQSQCFAASAIVV